MPFFVAFVVVLLLTQNIWIAAGFVGFAYVCSLVFGDSGGDDPTSHVGEV